MTIKYQFIGPLFSAPAIGWSSLETTNVVWGDACRTMIRYRHALLACLKSWKVFDSIAHSDERCSIHPVCWHGQFGPGKPTGNYDPATACLRNPEKLGVNDAFANFVAKGSELSNEASIGAIAGKLYDPRDIFNNYKTREKFTDESSKVGEKSFVPAVYFTSLLAKRLAWSAAGEYKFVRWNVTDIPLQILATYFA